MPQLLGGIAKIALIFAVVLSWELKTEAVEVERIEAAPTNVKRTKPDDVSSNQERDLNWAFLLNSEAVAQNTPQADREDRANRQLLDTVDRYNNDKSMFQMNSVDRLQDVSPDDWAYEALRGLVERYNCLAGYEDFTYRGDLTLSRYEFAASLNTCLNRLERAIANSENVVQEDIELLMRLMQDFQTDLAVLKGRTDGLQARTKELEITQFSTTTKLLGEAIFSLGGILAGGEDNSVVFGDRLRLELTTSFNGRDLLFTRLSTGNFPAFTEQTSTFAGNLAFAEPENNNLNLEVLFYNIGIGDNTNIILGTSGIGADDIAGTVNFLDGDGGSGAISAFGTRNPIYLAAGDAGLGIIHRPIEAIEISAGYLASEANDPSSGSGLFNGAFSAIGQVLFTPTDSLSFAATYIHGYNQSDTGTGSLLSNLQFLTEAIFGEPIPTASDSYGVELSWSLSDRIIVGGWGGYSRVAFLDEQFFVDRQDIWNWAATLAITDLGKQGSIGGLIIGMEPSVDSPSFLAGVDDSWHLEAFYQYRINDNIAVTPGVVWITAPDNDNDNDDLVIGTVRTTLSF